MLKYNKFLFGVILYHIMLIQYRFEWKSDDSTVLYDSIESFENYNDYKILLFLHIFIYGTCIKLLLLLLLNLGNPLVV